VRPIEIASPVWSPSAQRGWDNELEAAQRRFTERIRGLSDTAYSTRQLCTIITKTVRLSTTDNITLRYRFINRFRDIMAHCSADSDDNYGRECPALK